MRRIYSRPRTFDVECPSCTKVHVINRPNVRTPHWAPKVSELHCSCGRRYVVGIALWDVESGPRVHSRPVDQVPHAGAVRQLRAMIAGVEAGRVQKDDRSRVITSLVRVTREVGCTCTYREWPFEQIRRKDPGCPVHKGG